MSDYVPCDGCTEEATHHLCEECCNEPTGEYARGYADAIARVVADLRARASQAAVLEATRKARTLRELADRYERGEHAREST